MIVCRLLGWLLLLAAVGVAGWDLWLWIANGVLRLRSGGELWFQLHAASLNGFQVLVQRHLDWPALWDGWIVPILTWPAVVLLLILGVLVSLLCRARRRRYWFMEK